jgi:hypothetical protein
MCNKTNSKIDKWKKKMDDYYKTVTPEQFKNDLKKAGFIKKIRSVKK